jgi:hypothetical protein
MVQNVEKQKSNNILKTFTDISSCLMSLRQQVMIISSIGKVM